MTHIFRKAGLLLVLAVLPSSAYPQAVAESSLTHSGSALSGKVAAAFGKSANHLAGQVSGGMLSGKTTGAGILLVTGTLNFNGNPSFDGIVLVIGKGSMSVSGGGNGEFDGAVFIARTLDSSGNQLASGSAPGSPTLDWNGGGGNGIVFDSCYTSNLNNLFTYQKISFHELPY